MASISGLGGNADLSWSTSAVSNDIASSRPAIASTPPAEDTKAVNNTPEMAKVEALKVKDPTQFQQVLTDAVTNLKAAAKETADPLEVGFLWNLVNRFQLTLDTGDHLPLQASIPAPSPDPTAPSLG
jgi:hypothetical protein